MAMQNVSFLPEDYLENRIRRRTNLVCLALFAVVTVTVISAFLLTNRRRAEVQHQCQLVDAEFQDAADKLVQLDQLQDRKQRMLHKANVTTMLLERVSRSVILAELVNTLPSRVMMTELKLETKVDKAKRAKARTALEAAKRKAKKRKSKKDRKAERAATTPPAAPMPIPSKVTITVTGTAPTDVAVADYMTALAQSPLYEKVNLLVSEQLPDKARRRFEVQMQLNEDLRLGQFEPKMVRRDLKRNPITGLPPVPVGSPVPGSGQTAVLPAAHRRNWKQGD